MALTWQESTFGGTYSLMLAKGVLELTVSYNSLEAKSAPRGYRVSIGHRRLKALFPDPEAAKAAALTFARRVVAEMQADLERA